MSENKLDFRQILLERMRDSLVGHAIDPDGYTRFRDMIKAQAVMTLLNRKSLRIHSVNEALRNACCSNPHSGDDRHNAD